MKKLKMEIELTYDNKIMHGDDEEAIDWFFNDILKKDDLFLHSNELGDTVGGVKILKIDKERADSNN